MIVMSLLHVAKPIHELLSAFTRGDIRGFVYLECTMNQALVQLLSKTPGIIRSRQGLIFHPIELDDRTKLLDLPNSSGSACAGQWVQIRNGLYKGDVGLVSDTHSWGVNMLLVPRLSYSTNVTEDSKGKRKRKASADRNPPKLFDPEEFQMISSANIHGEGGHLFVGRLQFVHGLLSKRFKYSALTAPVFQMPWSISAMFALALKHHDEVDLKRRPRPEEWVFFEEEKVVVQSSGKKGVIRRLELGHAEVEYKDEGSYIVHWYNMQKDIAVGNFVTLLNGPQQGFQGWVIELTRDAAKVLDKIPTLTDTSTYEVSTESQRFALHSFIILQPIEVQVNRLRVTDTPFHLSQQVILDDIKFAKTPRHPWVSTEVVIVKVGHARKGEPGVVTAVLDDTTGIRLQVQLTRYDPNAPFTKITLDCDDVVEASYVSWHDVYARYSITVYF